MNESDAASTQADLEALQALQADVRALERLESLLDRFNVFEAIGFVGQETMHSRFLAFLLDPKQNHGLGDFFLRSFLQKVSESTDIVALPQASNSINGGRLDEIKVQTEVNTDDGRIDILLLKEVGEWAMIIENKVWSPEHYDQLERYYQFVKKKYCDWNVVCIYLTPYRAKPSHKEYLPLGYRAVCDVVDGVMKARRSTLDPQVLVPIEQYSEMVRRNIVGNPEVAELCQSLYRKHQRAFDLVIKHRFARQETIRELLLRLIKEDAKLVYNSSYAKCPEDYILFWCTEWDMAPLKAANWKKWGNTGRMLLFVFCNYPDRLDLILQIGPGDEETRYRLLKMAHNNPTVFDKTPQTLNDYVATIFARPMLTSDFYEDVSDSEREQEISRQWDEFLERDLPRIEEALKDEEWIWEPVESAEEPSSNPSRFGWGEGDIVITKRPEHEV